jgi:L-alanine-DL-glutamate epimerase-like enolase superfamily enzyme
MKIQHVKTNVVRLPHEEPLAGAPPAGSMMRDYVTVQIVTDDGIEGIGVTGFAGRLMRSLKAAVEVFGELAIGEDPLRGEAVMAKLRAAAAPCGPGGLATLALAAFDIALWDIRGKALGVSVGRLLGGLRERVPTMRAAP